MIASVCSQNLVVEWAHEGFVFALKQPFGAVAAIFGLAFFSVCIKIREVEKFIRSIYQASLPN